MNKYEWTRDLDILLMDTVVKNYFNFELAAKEVNEETIKRKMKTYDADSYTAEKCRIRWSYLHL
jgi:hypothetical protein